jgi:DNA-binding NarL/FixJ family response regulator
LYALASVANYSGESSASPLKQTLDHGALPYPLLTRENVVPTASILVADDNVVVLDRVQQLLGGSEEFNVVATVTDGDSVFQAVNQNHPDVIILDISMGDLSGIEVAAELRNRGCFSKIVFLTVHDDPDSLQAAMGAGGSAYVVKPRLSMDLISAIRAVLHQKIFISPTLMQT